MITYIWGPTKTASLGGRHWFVTFVDDFLRRLWVYTMKHKDAVLEILEIFLTWKKMIEVQIGKKIKVFRLDNGEEYKPDLFLEVCKKQGMVRHFIVNKTPQQNGVV